MKIAKGRRRSFIIVWLNTWRSFSLDERLATVEQTIGWHSSKAKQWDKEFKQIKTKYKS